MLSPALLDLYNAAVRSLPAQKKHLLKQVEEELDEAFKKASGRLDRLVNALEQGDKTAIAEHLKSYSGSSATYTGEQTAFFVAIQDMMFDAPEGVASPIVTNGDLSQLMESLPPATTATVGKVDPFEIPPQSPPAEVPAPAQAEPIPTPAVTPAEPGRSQPKKKR